MDGDDVTRSGNPLVLDAFVKADSVINEGGYGRVMCSVSGGSDSDIVMDLVSRVDRDRKTRYVFFDTGLEYEATKRHISYLEERYGVGIERLRPRKPIPVCCREIGEPFISKHVSEQIHRLQSHGFRWEDEPFDALYERYPRCRAALRWWSNDYDGKTGIMTSYCIGRNKWLREFIIENPPWFKISGKCCTYAKKGPADKKARDLGCDVRLIGTRKSEGGVRSLANRCFEAKDNGPDVYKPLYWLNDADKAEYCRAFDIRHSDCYEVWGFRRTGCVGCPFNRNVFDDLEVAAAYEPKMVNVARKVFADAYEYTRMFREFKADRKEPGQMRIDFGGVG